MVAKLDLSRLVPVSARSPDWHLDSAPQESQLPLSQQQVCSEQDFILLSVLGGISE